MSNIQHLNTALPGNLKSSLDEQNALTDVSASLLAQLQKLNGIDTDEVSSEKVQAEAIKSKAMVDLATQIISSERLLFERKKDFAVVSTQRLTK